MKAPFTWDHYSDQPYQLKDRNFKKAMRKKELFSLISTIFSALFILPIAAVLQSFISKRKISTDTFFGMSINLDREPEVTKALVDELEITTLLIRFPLWEMDRLDEYVKFAKSYQNKKIILNIMQDREHVEDLELLKKDLSTLFGAFSLYVDSFQVGSTINRAKWGFFSVREYLRFYRVAYQLKASYPNVTLLGPSVIDFEYHFTAHALFNFFKLKYDGVSALLYVDRRGAPENGQMGFDLRKKIDFLDALTLLSPKAQRKIYLTETNWPISNTAPYAPTSEFECVDEESYANFMVRYYLLAFATQKVDSVYWHQLVAPGYGLIDSREGIRKRTAFAAFKTMNTLLKEMELLSFEHKNGTLTLSAKNDKQTVTAIWSLEPKTFTYLVAKTYIDRDGKQYKDSTIEIGPSPIYFIEKSN